MINNNYLVKACWTCESCNQRHVLIIRKNPLEDRDDGRTATINCAKCNQQRTLPMQFGKEVIGSLYTEKQWEQVESNSISIETSADLGHKEKTEKRFELATDTGLRCGVCGKHMVKRFCSKKKVVFWCCPNSVIRKKE